MRAGPQSQDGLNGTDPGVCVCVCVHPLHKYVSETILFRCLFQKAGGTYLYKSYSYAPPQRVGFLRRFGLKTGIGLPILVWSRVWFSRELRECMKVFIVSMPNEYPGKSWKWIFKKIFLFAVLI